MPRVARKKSESGVYHIMMRGINQQIIFEEENDYERFLKCISECKDLSNFSLYAYCLMGNHIHLLLEEGKEPLQQIFKRIGARYVAWFNWKYNRCGHLFQDRFRSEPIFNDAQFMAVLRYIYQNPIKANLSKNLSSYPWSSFRNLGKNDALIDSSRIFEIMPIEHLLTFVEELSEEQFLDVAPKSRIIDKDATILVKTICGIDNLTGFQTLHPDKQAHYIKILHQEGCSIRQLSRLTGVTKGKVEKILRG